MAAPQSASSESQLALLCLGPQLSSPLSPLQAPWGRNTPDGMRPSSGLRPAFAVLPRPNLFWPHPPLLPWVCQNISGEPPKTVGWEASEEGRAVRKDGVRTGGAARLRLAAPPAAAAPPPSGAAASRRRAASRAPPPHAAICSRRGLLKEGLTLQQGEARRNLEAGGALRAPSPLRADLRPGRRVVQL
jgi:hypothetical protein